MFIINIKLIGQSGSFTILTTCISTITFELHIRFAQIFALCTGC